MIPDISEGIPISIIHAEPSQHKEKRCNLKIRADRAEEPQISRNVTLTLADSDRAAFLEFAARNGTTPEEILQGFVCDLIDGTQTRGSDERMYAAQYIDRCGYDLWPRSFLAWILTNGEMSAASDCIEDLSYAESEIEYYAEHPEDPDGADPEMMERLKVTLSEAKEALNSLYEAYRSDQDKRQETAQDMSKAVSEVTEYIKKLSQLE